MAYENLLYIGVGLVVGSSGALIYNKIRWAFNMIDALEDKLVDVESRILDPEEMAKKIITMKMPLSNLPPEVLEQLKRETDNLNTQTPSVKDGMNYVG